MGGTSPYQYNWNGNSSLTNSVENLYPGEVTVQIIDSNNCLETRFVTITEPQPLALKSEVIDESCVGSLDGSITVFHEGGTLPISVLWSNGGNTNQNKGIASGSYTVTIVDNGCILDSTIYVNSLPPLTYELNPFL
ncbi:MAG: SprB repeat-containing protein [Saprospiraceae bacterium]|nr:SprB repeat-containing protein [Saprospiraceae bacterium]